MAIKLCPIGGKINAFLFENENINLPLSLFLSIRIDLEEFQFQSEFEDTCIQLDFIKMKFNSFLDIENKEIEFALNPEHGYVDGSREWYCLIIVVMKIQIKSLLLKLL
jgi:hypothetical protein